MPGHRTEWGSRAFEVADPSCWNALPVELGICLSSDFCKTLEDTRVGLSDGVHTFEFVEFVEFDFCRVHYRVQYYKIIILMIYFENVHFFHAKLGLNVCPILNQYSSLPIPASNQASPCPALHIHPRFSCFCLYLGLIPTTFMSLQS